MSRIYIQVFDSHLHIYPTILTNHNGQDVVLVYDPVLAAKIPLNGAVFVDENALSNAVFRFPRHRRWCLLQESPIRGLHKHAARLAKYFDTVLSFDQRLLELGAPFESFYYGTSWINKNSPVKGVQFDKHYLCTFIGNIAHNDDFGYSLRKQVAEQLLNDTRVECWGKGIRPFDSKDALMYASYFSIAMENTQQDLYFTEKLIDCFVTETVPIYWGAPSIGDVFDSRGMLCFDTLPEMMKQLETLSVEQYQSMLPWVRTNRDRVFEMGLTGHDTLGQRLTEQLLKKPALSRSSLKPAWRSKAAALCRKLAGA